MQLMSGIHEGEARLELENQTDVTELKVGVDHRHPLVLEAGQEHGHVGRDDGLSGPALGTHDDDDLTFVRVGSRPARPPPCALEHIVGELLDRLFDLLLGQRCLDDLGDAGPHGGPEQPRGHLVGYRDEDAGKDLRS